jgi:DNA-directed RNA polymerase subunit RPC12/RpoP
MSAGDWHSFSDGQYTFRETIHGPFMKDACVDCGAEVYSVQPTGRINQWGLEEDTTTVLARCSTCGRKYHGLPAF